MITTRGLSRDFRQRHNDGLLRAVRSVDIDVLEGEVVGFLGPNGAGKTTTMRMLTTLLRPTSGEATVAGCDLLSNPSGVRSRIGYVAQGSGLAGDCSPVEELVLQARLYGLSWREAVHRAHSLLDELDLSGLSKRKIRTLSGGQRRRLDIALGLIHSPKLVFLDEPTTGLDPQSRVNLWEHISRLNREMGVTVFLTTHYLDEADALAGRVFIVDNGTVVASGTPAELKSTVAGDSVTVSAANVDASSIADVVSRKFEAHDIFSESDTVRFRVPDGAGVVSKLVRSLDDVGIELKTVEIVHPSLDDVFFSITGRSLRDSDGAKSASSAVVKGEEEVVNDVG
ncbi:ATP-binding cassette domain-containing protein [Lentzea alba]|uniref:ATP-binding cassette domain-containing protein n=1 Tax=Lentzea alba TaxID=2714351 RepID=UPI0039BFC09D